MRNAIGNAHLHGNKYADEHADGNTYSNADGNNHGDTVEFVRSVYRGDRYRLVAELSQRRGRELQPVGIEFAAGAPGDGA